MHLKKLENYLRVNLLWPGPRLMKKEFTRPRSHKVWETLISTTPRPHFRMLSSTPLQRSITYSGLYVSLKFHNSKILLQIPLHFTCNKTSSLPSDMCPTVAATHFPSALSSVSLLSGFVVGSSLSAIFQSAVVCACDDVVPVSPDVALLGNPSALYADASAIDLIFDPTSAFLLINILVTGSSPLCEVFCSSIADRRVSVEYLVPWFPLFKICYILLSADPSTSSPLTLAYSFPSRLFPLPFRCNPPSSEIPVLYPAVWINDGKSQVVCNPVESTSKYSNTPLWHISTSQHSTQDKSAGRKLLLCRRQTTHIILPLQKLDCSFFSCR